MKELYTYRELVKHMIVLDLKLRYRGSFFGFLWTLLNPLLLMLVMWAVFSRFGRVSEKNYALFLLSGLMVWTFFQQSITNSLNSIVKQKGLMRKIYLPKLVFPVSVCGSNLINVFFFLVAYFIIAGFTVIGWPPTSPLVLPALLMLLFTTVGVSLVVATLNVFFRDVEHITQIVLRAFFYLTPVLYPPDLLGPKAGQLLQFNPVYYPVVIARASIYYGEVPSLWYWSVGYGVSFVIMGIGVYVFTRAENKFVYYA